MSQHPIVHIEISTKDREAGAIYYSELFGWKFRQIPEMNYATFEAEGGLGVGLNPISVEYPAGTVMVYIGCEDIDAMLAKIESIGGKVVVPKSEIPDTGWFGIFQDLTGNQIALYTALQA